MKKFIFLIMIGMYSLIFTNDKYDIDISENYVNLKAEINSEVKNFDFDKAFIPVREEIKKEMKLNPEINIVVELEKMIGEDEIIYNKTFKK
ncbi:hypothetical protein [Fusobacterium sp. THCT1E2]